MVNSSKQLFSFEDKAFAKKKAKIVSSGRKLMQMKNHDTHNQYTKLRWSSIIMANEMTVMVFTQINFECERENFLFVTSKMVAIMQHYFTINASIMQDTSFHFI